MLQAATFSGNARLEVPDSTGGLSWNSGVGALTVQCWFKLTIPTGTNLTENLTILANRRGGSTNDTHAYLIEFDIYTGNIEFSTRGSGFRRFTLVERPYLDRWYHVAVVRQAEEFTVFVDGRAVSVPAGATVGDARSTDGVAIGGWNVSGSQGRFLFGEVQEVSVYQAAFDQSFISQNMFAEQPAIPELKGYFKLGFSTNTAQSLANSAPAPVPAGTETASKQGVGTVTFEEANQAGEQSAFDSRRNGGRDAVTPLSGAFSWEQVAFARPVPGIAFDFRFGYSSANGVGGSKLGGIDPYAAGPMGKGWRHTFETRVLPAQTFSPLSDTDTLGLMLWNGALETWDLDYDLGEYRPRTREYKGELLVTTTNCQWTTPERLLYVFKRPDTGSAVMRGRLTEIRDFNGNRVRVQWDEIRGRLTNVLDTTGANYSFDTNSLLRFISFGSWQVNFSYDATNRLVSKSVTNTAGLYASANTTWQFAYNATNGLLESIRDPRGNINVLVQYDQYGRKTNAVDALGRATRTEYNVPANRQIRNTDAAGYQWLETYDRKGHILAQQDPLTNVTRYTYDGFGNRTSVTEPLGWTTFFGYDDRANVIARTNALGEVTRWNFHPFFNKAVQQITPQPPDASGWTAWTNFYTYDAGGNLTNHSDALGSLVRYTYSTNGLVLTSTDANGNVSQFGYDTNGFLTSRTDPATNTTTFVVNDVGWKLREINPLGDATAYTLDVNGNPVRVQDVLSRVFNRTYDANGNLLSTTDGKGQLTTHAYDAANQRTNTTDRTGTNQWLTFYTLRGKVDRVTDPLGNSVTNFYDAANRLIRVTDPVGNSITNQYDANGNLIALFDKLGQRWSKTYDRLNRVLAETDPLGNTRSTAYDTAGRLLQTTSPNGNPTLHAYDGRGRLTKWHDAEGFDWLYTYDGNGNITDIEDALHGHYVMAYGPRNERILERNQDAFEWRYEYDELLRLQRQTDPNGTTRTPTYDAAGRVLFVNFSTGRRDSYAYDANNNPQTISRRVSGVTTATQFIYDALDRPIEQTDALAQTVRYGYDPLGRVTTLTYPGGKTLTNRYDTLGRLTSQVDWAGRPMTYAYDRADRLTRRAWPNGVTQNNTFDDAGRLTGLSHSAIGNPLSAINVALTYAYDRNGNKTSSSEKGTLPWPQPSLTDETARFTPAGRLIDRDIEITNHVSRITYSYDPSGNMTNAVMASGGATAQSWSLTYDEDNRTTSIHWDAGLTAKHIVNRYDALGRRISKTVDGETTGYVLSLVGGMERILCDLDNGGTVTAWYIHGPDLCYRVDAATNVVCYHADAMANIIALTGTGGTNLVQYAYTPYGRSLGSSAISNLQSQISNPYLFVGSQGVMEELPGLYFMRARYYSADAGVFLSTDPVMRIGPGWKPMAYGYGSDNPLGFTDPKGEYVQRLLAIWALSAAKEVLNQGVDDLAIEVSTAAGFSQETSETVVKTARAFHSLSKEIDEARDLYRKASAAGGSAAQLLAIADYAASKAGQWSGKLIYSGSKVVANSVGDAGAAIGQQLNAALFQRGPNGPMAVSTPMYVGMSAQTTPTLFGLPASQISAANQSLSPRAPAAGATANSVNAATSANPSSPSASSGSTSSGGTSITIPRGATLSGLAQQYGTTVSGLMSANPQISNPNVIYAGASLNVPSRNTGNFGGFGGGTSHGSGASGRW
ncbi:MAG: LysM peptidoglycan-binding domain-containing protein [Verrucomicrobia bacterium]|nr:LysM peptidoglycan-binding domain-containing protein [Verrucomicrobiota bacterium]